MMPSMSPRPAMIFVSLTVLALAGCGSADERGDAAASVAVRMLSAVADEDGAAACAALAPDTVSEIEQSAGEPCAEAILDEDLPAPGTVTRSEVYGQWTKVRLTGDSVFLGVFPGGTARRGLDDHSRDLSAPARIVAVQTGR